MTCQERETLRLFFQEHFAQVAVSKTYFTLYLPQNPEYRTPEDLHRLPLQPQLLSLQLFLIAIAEPTM